MDNEQRFLEAQKLYQKQIADLEAKLAESEKKARTYAKEIVFLDKKLEDKDQELNDICQNYDFQINDFSREVHRLKEREKILEKQLAEKEKFLERIMSGECIPANIAEKSLKLSNQTAIAELNNILDTFAIFVNEEKESMVSPDGNGNLSLLEYIENRIDTLKGGK